MDEEILRRRKADIRRRIVNNEAVLAGYDRLIAARELAGKDTAGLRVGRAKCVDSLQRCADQARACEAEEATIVEEQQSVQATT